MHFAKRIGSPQRDDDTADAVERADAVTYTPIDEASAVPMSSVIRAGWHVPEYENLAAEQKPLWRARGEEAARPHTVDAARLRARHQAGTQEIEVQRQHAEKAGVAADLHHEVLDGLTRREPHAKVMYLTRWALLLFGDVAGIAGAAVLLGEIPTLAVFQAVSAAIAAVTAGIVGHDIRDSRLARRRARDTSGMAVEHRNFAWLFSGADSGEKLVKAMVCAAVTILLLIFGGVFALRSGVEGSLSGIVFGCLAGAICLASALNTYQYADEVADLLERADARRAHEVSRHLRLAKNRWVAAYEASAAEAASIKAEHADRGDAGAMRYEALKFGISRQNPGVMGHGPSADGVGGDEPSLFATTWRTGVIGHATNGGRS